jgi:hypothetical protein
MRLSSLRCARRYRADPDTTAWRARLIRFWPKVSCDPAPGAKDPQTRQVPDYYNRMESAKARLFPVKPGVIDPRSEIGQFR